MKKVFVLSLVAAILSAAMLAGCSKPIENPTYTSAPNGEKIIDENTAKRAAAERAEISEKDISFTKVFLDSDDGRYEYDIEFVHDGYEYELEVDADDGKIISYERERAENNARAVVNNVDGVSENNSVSDSKYISEDEALLEALKRAQLENVEKEALAGLKIEFEFDDGVPEYEVDFYYDGYEYDITVNAESGAILKFEKEAERKSERAEEPASQPDNSVTAAEPISHESAKAIALAHAGVSYSDIFDYEWELDRDGAVLKYEIDFKQGGFEYSYDINAVDGTILHWEKEIDD